MPRADKIGLVALLTLAIALVVYLLWPRAAAGKATATDPKVNLDSAAPVENASIDKSQGENELFSVDKDATSRHMQSTGPTIVQVI